jgi:hypothetical protein
MKTSIPSSAKDSQNPSKSSHGPFSSQQSGRLAQLAAMVNHSPRVHAQLKLRDEIQNSQRVQQQMSLAGEINQAKPKGAAEGGGCPPALLEGSELGPGTGVIFGTVVQRQPSEPPAQREKAATPNRTGLPDQLKSGVESISGLSLDDVKVHYNSAKPAQLNALAYAQGTDIHVAPGQEKHLPHEAWHIVQQKQGRVQPTMQMRQSIPVNNDRSLEREADTMGAQAMASSVPGPMTQGEEPLQGNFSTSSPGYEVVQGAFRVTPTDFDPVANAVIHSTFTNIEFGQVLANLAGQAGLFHAELVKPINNPAHGNFTFAFINANVADQQDLPSLTTAIIIAICGANAAAVLRLTPHAGQLTRLLGMFAPTRAANPDKVRFRLIAGAAAVVLSRAKGVPSTVPYASLAAVSAGAYNAVTNRRNEIVNKNNDLDDMNNYISHQWNARGRASGGMNQIRSPHTNNAGWLPAAAAGTGALEVALLAATLIRGNALSGSGKLGRQGRGQQLVAWHGAAAQASDVEDNVDLAADATMSNQFYRRVFWPTVATKAERVRLAWSRYAADFGVPNGAYIEFNGGGAAARVIWDYVNDLYYISAHYNWVDGYNPHFEVTGLAASY